MTNADLMEEVMCKAHSEGIVREVQDLAKEIRESKKADLYDSYIQAYDKVSKGYLGQDNLDLT